MLGDGADRTVCPSRRLCVLLSEGSQPMDSNEKTKGKGNQKNGNKYLAWAFSEAAEFARRYDAQARSYYTRKIAEDEFHGGPQCARSQVVRAAYYVMRDQVPFEPEKLFT